MMEVDIKEGKSFIVYRWYLKYFRYNFTIKDDWGYYDNIGISYHHQRNNKKLNFMTEL